MHHRLHPQPGYPFALDVAITYTLAGDGLSVRTSATNIGSTPCPYGTGAHPYLTAGTPTVDAVILQSPGRLRLETDDRGIPTGASPVTGTGYDFLAPRQLGDTKLDTGYTDLVRGEDGLARVELQGPDSRVTTLWLDENYPYLMLFTGDSLPDPGRRRRGLGIEPMTCAPNAFQSGEGLLTIPPGETCSARWGITAGPR
jgi:aldose 1-epimerase